MRPPAPCTALLVLALSSGPAAEPLRAEPHPAADLEGCWIARAVVGAQASPVRLGLAVDGDRLLARLDLPDAGVFGLGPGEVAATERGIALRFLELERTADGGLRGALPEAFDPADPVTVVFRRTPWLQPDCATPRPAPIPRELWSAEVDGGVWATPLLDPAGAGLVVGTLAGELVALDPATGARRWSVALGGSVRSTPVQSGDAVLAIADDGRLTAVAAADGAVRGAWPLAAPLDEPFRDPASDDYHRRGHQLLAAGGRLYVGTLAGELLAVDPASGEVRARTALDGPVTALAAGDGRIYAATLAGSVGAWSPDLAAAWAWKARGPVHGGLTATGEALFLGDRGYYLHALDPATGAALWSRKVFFSWVESTPIRAGGALLVGSSDARSTFALDPATGAELWRAEVDGWAWATPVVVGGALAQGVAGREGYLSELRPGLVLLDPVTGAELSRLELPLAGTTVTGVIASPVAAGDTLFVAEAPGRVRAFGVRPPAAD